MEYFQRHLLYVITNHTLLNWMLMQRQIKLLWIQMILQKLLLWKWPKLLQYACLEAHQNKMDTHNTNTVNAQKKEDTSKKRKNKNAAQPAREAKRRCKSKPKSVSFTLPVQRSIRRDNVDKQCRTLNIMYKWWEGMKDEKEQYHKSQMAFRSKSKIPKDQDVPGNCLLCPLKKIH